VNNLHIITLYKLLNKLSCESRLSRSPCWASRARRVEQVKFVVSSVSSRAGRQARHSQSARARHVEYVKSCRVETWRVRWNLGYSQWDSRRVLISLSTQTIILSTTRS